MAPRLTYEDSRGDTQLKPWALPLIVAAICVPIAAAFLSSSNGAAAGLAVGAAIALVVVVWAVRSRPFAKIEAAASSDEVRRVLVIAPAEISGPVAQRVHDLAAGADDVRILVPEASQRLDRWTSATDKGREAAQDSLARSAGALTAQGLRVSGSVGDHDLRQAVEDELRSFAADEVLVVSGDEDGEEQRVKALRDELALPLTRVPSG